jgi:hypothetical protein
MIRGWSLGMRKWSSSALTSSVALLSVSSSPGLRDAVRRLRRGLRDVRDRVARGRRHWHEVGFAGMASGDHRAMVLISHEGMDRCDVLDVLRHRWLDVLIKEPKREEPTWAIRRRC